MVDKVFSDPTIAWMLKDVGVKDSAPVRDFMKRVSGIESSDNPKASNKTSSAKGAYQWLNGEKPDGSKGLNVFAEDLSAAKIYYKKSGEQVPKWIEEAEKHNDPRKLSPEEQDKLFLLRMYRLGKNADLKKAFSGDRLAARKLYFEKHHTAPDEQTIRRVDLFMPMPSSAGMLLKSP